jgi:phosphatidylinositol glycan class N
VFNQSSSTYSFGSPDILPMFAKGATPGRVKEWSYHEDDEDFTKDATALDLWVLDNLEQLFLNATLDPTLNSELRQDRVVIFLHLLGLDTTGHSYRPHSKVLDIRSNSIARLSLCSPRNTCLTFKSSMM